MVTRVAAPAREERTAALRCLTSPGPGVAKHAVLARAAQAQDERLLAALADYRLAVMQGDETVQ
jgi:hypothetical protein